MAEYDCNKNLELGIILFILILLEIIFIDVPIRIHYTLSLILMETFLLCDKNHFTSKTIRVSQYSELQVLYGMFVKKDILEHTLMSSKGFHIMIIGLYIKGGTNKNLACLYIFGDDSLDK